MSGKVLKPALVLTVICLIVTALLAGTNQLTRDTVAQQKQETLEESRRTVLPDANRFEEIGIAEEDMAVSAGYDEAGKIVGYVFETTGKGYGGTIQVMTGMTAQGEITKVDLVSHSETPGLGTKAENEDFISQYNKQIPDGGFIVKKNAASSDDEIQAVTGATITSKGVTSAVNDAITLYETYVKGGAGDNG